VRAVQLREKDLDSKDVFEFARNLLEITSKYGSSLLVNERCDISLAAGLQGVHCPEQGFPAGEARRLLGPEGLVGVSCHSIESVHRAAESGASFVFFGPVYSTPAKVAYGPPVGLHALRNACTESSLPVFAIGGVTPDRTTECMDAGASGVAVIRFVLANDDIESSVRSFEDALGGL